PVKRITMVEHLGRTHFRIRTRTATYLYDPAAGGFSSIIDREGKDWVQYRDEPWGEYPASAASSYRGVPNLVFGGDDDGAGHPGHKKCESRVVAKNQIHTVSLSGEWAWTWTFYKDCARLEVEKTPDDRPYWFLYEGPAGGAYQPRTTFWATDLDAPSHTINDHFRGKVQRGQYRYLFFGEDQSLTVFFMLQQTPDTHGDHVSYLGNEEIGAADSPDGMVVAGFGRAEGATPLLTGPNSFLIGFQRYTANEKIRLGKVRRNIERLGRLRGNR
ncbi:MAG: hypothetical protein AAFN92_12700, partial [Bacteroidota bacterium]